MPVSGKELGNDPECLSFYWGPSHFFTIFGWSGIWVPYLTSPDLATVTHALDTSRLDYCNFLYLGGCPGPDVETAAGEEHDGMAMDCVVSVDMHLANPSLTAY